MAVICSSSNMIIYLRNHHSPVRTVAFSKVVFVNPISFKTASNFTKKPSSFAIKALKNESEQSETEVQLKRSLAAPTKPEVDNFKEPEEEPQSLNFVEAKQSGSLSSKTKTAITTQTSIDYQEVLKYPIVTEAAIQSIIKENTLVFMVDVRANKKDIRNAFENMLNIKTKKINTLINYDGTKKAYIQLPPDNQAVTIAKRLKILA
ncbi:hypothetical protein R6Q59_029323 [Mikania micrantha]